MGTKYQEQAKVFKALCLSLIHIFICAVFGLQDIGTELSLFHSTALDDDLAPLTYVFVVPNDSDLASFLSFPSVKERLLRT